MQVGSRFSWILAVVGLLSLVAAGSIAYAIGPEDPRSVWIAAAGLALLAGWAYLERESVGRGVQERGFQQSLGAVVLTALVGGIVTTGYVVSHQHDKRWDWTGKGTFTISSYTASVIGKLDHDVTVYAVFRKNSPASAAFDKLFEGYRTISPHLVVDRVDPVADPLRARQLVERYSLTEEDGTLIFVDGENWQKIEGEITEERITNALVKLPTRGDHRLCWVLGHGEGDPDDESSEFGYGAVILKLEDKNYAVVKRDIVREGLNADCEAALVVFPKEEWLPQEREVFATYLSGGGRALVLLEPTAVPELARDFERFGVTVGADVVLEANPELLLQGFDPSMLLLSEPNYGVHPITAPLRSRSLLEGTRSVSPTEPAPEGIRVSTLAKTSDQAWGETNFDFATTPPSPDAGVDRTGPVSLAVAAEWEAAGGRLVVFGDASFADNTYMTTENNQDLFFNSVAWLVDEAAQIGEQPEEGVQTLAMNSVEVALLALTTLLFVPGAAVAIGVAVLLRRRFL